MKQLNAKKLDIDFGADDFFNSFQPAKAEPEPLFNLLNNNNNSAGGSSGAASKSNKL